MKKLTKFIVYIFLSLVLFYIFFILLSLTVFAGSDISPRGVPITITYNGGALNIPENGIDGGLEVWLDHIIQHILLCGKQNQPQTYGEGPYKYPEIVTYAKMSTDKGSSSEVKLTSWVNQSWSDQVLWDANGDDVEELSIEDLIAIRTNQPSGKSGTPSPGPEKVTGKSPIKIKTNGKTSYKVSGGQQYKNDAMSYVLAEQASDDGYMPAASPINVLFWMLKNNPKAHDGSVSTEYFTSSSGGKNTETLEDILSDYQEQLEDPNLSPDMRASLEDTISQLEDMLTTSSVRDEMYDVPAETARKSSSLYREALIFSQMWHEIYNKYSGDYLKSVVDKTEKKKVHAQFNTTGEGDKRFYIVGPFKINYLEYYTPVVNGKGAQFCGMTGKPELTVKRWGNEEGPLKYGEDYKIVYGKFEKEGEEFKEKRATFPNIPEEYTVDQHPHSGEEFYIKLYYQEGINAIAKMKFKFRYLEASANTTEYEGNILTQEWTISGDIDWCEAGHKCEHGREEAHDDPYQVQYTCHGTADSPCEHGSTTDHIAERTEYAHCDGGTACEHGFYHKHALKATADVDVKYNNEKLPFQPTPHVNSASRGFKGGGDNDDNNNSQVGKISKEIVWDIDLTTTLMGYVWKDLSPDEKTGSGGLIGQWENKGGNTDANAGDVAVANIPVKVYLYDQSGTKVGDALIHNKDGSKYEGDLITDSEGRWGNPNKITFEAPGTGKELFYVIEFEYDGQFFKDVPFLGTGGGAGGYMDEQPWTAAYSKEMNDENAERSKAVTEVADRKEFDEKFGIITGESPMSGTSTTGFTCNTGGGNTGELKYEVKPSTEINNKEGQKAVISRLDEPWDEDSNSPSDHQKPFGGYYDRFRLKASTYYKNTPTYGCKMVPENYKTKYPEKKVYWLDKIKDGDTHLVDEYMRHLNLGLVKRAETDLSLVKDLYKVTTIVNEQKQVYQYNPYGSTKSKYVEFATTLEDVRGVGYTLGLYESDVAYSSMVRYEQAMDTVKERKKGTELRVFATYVIRLYNNSIYDDVEFREVRDYLDKAYTVIQDGEDPGSENYRYNGEFLEASIINDDMKREWTRIAETPYYRVCSQDTLNVWEATKGENGGEYTPFKWTKEGNSLRTSSLEGKKVTKNEYIELFTTFEVDREGYDKENADNFDGDALTAREALIDEHKNTAEISSYSTYYGEENVYRNHKVGDIAGRVDKDSAPNNIRYGDSSSYEDDTFEALSLKLDFNVIKRELTGIVFEDKKTKILNGHPTDIDGVEDSSETFEVKVGDGRFNGGDKGVEGVEVSLYEVINLGELDNNVSGTYAGLEYYYRVPDEFYGGAIKTGADGRFKMDGFLAGDYIVRYDYGKNADEKSVGVNTIYNLSNPDGDNSKDIIVYNGQDYENTGFLGDCIGEGDNSQLNMKFLPIDGKDANNLKDQEVSKARDNEARRLEVIGYSRTIENERGEILRDRVFGATQDTAEFVEKTKMFAETPIIKIEVEDPSLMKSKKETNNPNTSLFVYEEGGKPSGGGLANLLSKKVQINNIDFGLEERARTDIELKTFVNRISLYKANETVFEVNVNDDGTLNYDLDTSRSRKLISLPSSYEALNQQGFYSLEVENDYLNGLELVIKYKIEVLNNSEIDFTSRIGRMYRQDVLEKYAQGTPTTTFYEDLIRDYGNHLNPMPGDGSVYSYLDETLNVDQISANNVFRLNSNALKKVFGGEDLAKYSNLENFSSAISSIQQEDTDTLRPEVIVYGLFTGRYYYENKLFNRVTDTNTYTISDYLRDVNAEEVDIAYEHDQVVRTTVNKVVDYVDIDASFDLPSAGYTINRAWSTQGEGDKTGQPDQVEEVNGKINYTDNSYKVFKSMLTDASYRTVNGDTDFYDYKDRKYVSTGSSNIGFSENDSIVKMEDHPNREEYSTESITNNRNINLSRQLEPAFYVCPSYMNENYGGPTGDKQVYFQKLDDEKKSRILGEMFVSVVKNTSSSQDADEINIDNLVEVLVYSNSVGRRDAYSVPGNALAIGAVNNSRGEEKSVWYSGYNSIKNNAYGRNSSFAFRNLIANSARSVPDGEWPNGKINEVTRNWMLYPEDDQWAPEYITVIPPTGIALRNYLANNLPQVIVAMLAVIGLGVLFIYKQIRIRRNKNKF